MAFWTDNTTPEPLRQNRWYIYFGNELLDNFRWALKECQKPSFELSFTEHKLLTHKIKYPGKLKWRPIEIKMASVRSSTESLDKVLESLKEAAGYNPINSQQHQQITKDNSAISKSNEILLVQFDSEEGIKDIWKINNPYITSLNYGTLSYESDNFVDISFTLNYDWAEIDREVLK